MICWLCTRIQQQPQSIIILWKRPGIVCRSIIQHDLLGSAAKLELNFVPKTCCIGPTTLSTINWRFWQCMISSVENWAALHLRLPNCHLLEDHYSWYIDTAPASRIVRSISSLGVVLSNWLITRYGYHFTTIILVATAMNLVFVILSLFNLLKPGIKVTYIIYILANN